VLSDWAAALLARANRAGTPADLPAALDAASRAVALAANLPEARYNRALALERLSLHDQAIRAWEDYLSVDVASPWSRDARSRLDRLRTLQQRGVSWWQDRARLLANTTPDAAMVRRMVDECPQETRELIEDHLLPRWGAAARAHDPTAGLLWSSIRVFATALADSRRDLSLFRLTESLRAALEDDRVLERVAETLSRLPTTGVVICKAPVYV
jgi:tetratricopeptide (TPR) repeat protein